MKKLLIIAAFALTAVNASAQNKDAFRKDIAEYLTFSNQMKAFENLTKDLHKSVPLSKQADFKKELAVITSKLEQKIIDIYMQEFTPEDIAAVLQFYKSPVGQKLTAKFTVLYDKGQKAGEIWGQELQALMQKYQ